LDREVHLNPLLAIASNVSANFKNTIILSDNTLKMDKKLLKDITVSDLLDYSVWEFWIEDKIEYVKPDSKKEISEKDNVGYIVLTDFELSNKSKFIGFCSPQDTSGLDYIQPVLLTDKGQIVFYRDSEWTNDEKIKELQKIGHDTNDVFPVFYRTRIKCDGKFYNGILKDFNKQN
jgi:hypothetical protein